MLEQVLIPYKQAKKALADVFPSLVKDLPEQGEPLKAQVTMIMPRREAMILDDAYNWKFFGMRVPLTGDEEESDG